jgi:hypothetical protein
MFELDDVPTGTPMIDFGRNGKVLFQLPVLGAVGVPLGITSAFSLFYDKFQAQRTLTDGEVSAAWNLLIQTLADAYPDATRQLARLDEANVKFVIQKWVQESSEQGYDHPKA